MSEPNSGLQEPKPGTVFIVDGDPAARRDFASALDSSEHRVVEFPSGDSFLDAFTPNGPACLIVDETVLAEPGSELLGQLGRREARMPSVVITSKQTTPISTVVHRLASLPVLEKPSLGASIRETVDNVLERDRHRHHREAKAATAREKLAKLSDAERQVLEMVVEGMPNKLIAAEVGVCVRTVEARRSRIYQSCEVGSVPELVRLCIAGGLIEA